jgi:hypothetical protein
MRNGGQELRPKGNPESVRVHDFKLPELGKVSPYGVYDITDNSGWVNVGIDHDTAAFAVESIRRWWNVLGQERYPGSTGLLITADCGGSNGARVRLWKHELQGLADETGLAITVAHHPPGTSKWNRIEHRLFALSLRTGEVSRWSATRSSSSLLELQGLLPASMCNADWTRTAIPRLLKYRIRR